MGKHAVRRRAGRSIPVLATCCGTIAVAAVASAVAFDGSGTGALRQPAAGTERVQVAAEDPGPTSGPSRRSVVGTEVTDPDDQHATPSPDGPPTTAPAPSPHPSATAGDERSAAPALVEVQSERPATPSSTRAAPSSGDAPLPSQLDPSPAPAAWFPGTPSAPDRADRSSTHPQPAARTAAATKAARADATKSAEKASPADPTKSAEKASPTRSAEKAAPADPTRTARPTTPTTPTERTWRTSAATTSSPAEPTEPTSPTRPATRTAPDEEESSTGEGTPPDESSEVCVVEESSVTITVVTEGERSTSSATDLPGGSGD